MARHPGDGSERGVGRRGFLAGTMGAGATALLAACTNREEAPQPAARGGDGDAQGGFASPGRQVTIAFSAPGADHGWLAAIVKNAEEAASRFSDVEFVPTEANTTSEQQIGQIESLINSRPDVLVILPQEGQALTAVARRAMEAGIPVVNLDRIFAERLAYRVWVGGDNYGMGVSAGHFIGQELRRQNVSDPVIVEIAGLDSLQLTRERSQGFADALSTYGLRVDTRQAAEFTADSGQEVMSNVLQRVGKIDAVWNHDDDQGIGVDAAIREAGRDEFFMVGGAGSRRVMEELAKPDSLYRADVLYSPIMAGTAINLARLIAQGRGLDETWEKEVPSSITLFAGTVTKDNVDQYLELGF